MNRDKLINVLFEKGNHSKIEEMEVYINKISSMDINIYTGDLEAFTIKEEETLSVRGIYNGRMGYAYTEKLLAHTLDELIDNLIQYAENNHKDKIETMIPLGQEIKPVEKDHGLWDYSIEEKIKYMLDLEKRAYDTDPRIKTISRCNYKEETKEIYIKNTKGLALKDTHTFGMIHLGVVAETSGNMQTGYAHHVFNHLRDEYKDLLIEESVGDALNMLGATSIAPGNKEVILRNNVAAELFANFIPVFYGNVVQENLSLLKGRVGKSIAVSDLNIMEDPFKKDGVYYRTFDDEGTLVNKKYVVEKGLLRTLLHNNKTAEIEGVKSTGNGFRESHKSSIGMAATNLYIAEGQNSLKNMINTMNEGIVITEIHGLHAGINSISGNFSLSANGLLIKEGQVSRPLAQITIAGNFFSLLKNIKCIGKDTKFSSPSATYFGAPSIYVGSLSVSGK